MAEGLKDLVGDILQGKDGNIDTATFAGKKIGLYFSAHWCPPCRGFTPKLIDWYNNFKSTSRKDEMEMIFASSDREEETFDKYYAEMPWHALPYAERDRKAALSKKFKVSGIPTLLIIDADTGDVITKNGRAKIVEDPKGENFPWLPKSVSEMLKGSVRTKEGEKVLAELLDGKVRAIYFSAHWCPPCRSFTPDLIKCYNNLIGDGKKFEILFVSWDRDEEAFEEYYKDMPWATFPREDDRAKELAGHFDVEGIPTLVILDEDNNVLTRNGRGAVSEDPEGKEFPWSTKPLNGLTSMWAGMINEAAALIFLTDTDDESKTAEAECTMKPVAEKYFAERKTNKKMEEMNFFYECKQSDDLPDSLRGFAKLPDGPVLLLLNIPDQEKYVLESDNLTQAQVEDVVNKFKTKTLDMKPMQG